MSYLGNKFVDILTGEVVPPAQRSNKPMFKIASMPVTPYETSPQEPEYPPTRLSAEFGGRGGTGLSLANNRQEKSSKF